MLERFNEEQIILIRKCCDAVRSIENGTANQKNVNYLFDTSYFFTTFEDDPQENMIDVSYARNEINERSNYSKLIDIVSENFPDVNKAYIPFMVGDVLREAYVKYNSEVK